MANRMSMSLRWHINLRIIGIGLIFFTVAGVAYPLWWQYRSNENGGVLLQRAFTPPPIVTRKSVLSNGCGNSRFVPSTPTAAHPGVLEIPALKLTAPVLQGLGTSILDVAIGHDPITVWPGAYGESVLLAHDVSYFSEINQLHRGETVIWKMGCQQAVFKVISTEVTSAGATIFSPSSTPGLALITCWPTDALFWTTQRYVVETALVNQHHVS